LLPHQSLAPGPSASDREAGHWPGFPPTGSCLKAGFALEGQGARRCALGALAAVPATLVFYEMGLRLVARPSVLMAQHLCRAAIWPWRE
jgi:16S rRNA C1402 (ribose-2'-O) methylase RsmI